MLVCQHGNIKRSQAFKERKQIGSQLCNLTCMQTHYKHKIIVVCLCVWASVGRGAEGVEWHLISASIPDQIIYTHKQLLTKRKCRQEIILLPMFGAPFYAAPTFSATANKCGGNSILVMRLELLCSVIN